MKETLRDLIQQSNDLMLQLAEGGGELTTEMETQLLKIETTLPAKIDGYSYIIERLESETEFWKKKSQFYSAIAKSCDGLRDRLRGNIKFAMTEQNVKEIVGYDIKFKLTKAKSSLVIDEKKLDKKYFDQVVSQVVNKDRVEADLKLGVVIPGAEFVENTALRTYPNKGE